MNCELRVIDLSTDQVVWSNNQLECLADVLDEIAEIDSFLENGGYRVEINPS